MGDTKDDTLRTVQGVRRAAQLAPWLSAGALALAGLYPGNNPDTFAHLAQGRQIAELGRVPAVDTWSLLPGPPRTWHNYEWLSDLLFYGLYRAFGYNGLLAFKCGLLFVTGLLLLRFASRLAGDRAVLLGSLVLVSTIPGLRFRLSDRPHVLGMCFAALYLVSLAQLVDADGERAARIRLRWVAALFGLHVLWVNLHGSHLLGMLMTGAFAALSPRSARTSVAALLGLEAVASCVSPYGPAIVLDAVGHVLDPRYRSLVTEWAPWDEETPPWLQLGPVLQGALLAIVAPRLARAGASARASLLVVAVLGLMGFRSIRFVGEFLLLSTPLVGAGYAELLQRLRERPLLLGVGAAVGVLAFVVPGAARDLPPALGLGTGALYTGRPKGPGELLARAAVQPRIFAAMEHAWPLMWWAPNGRFFVDGRVPFYGPDHVGIAILAMGDPGLFDVVARTDGVNAVVLNYTMKAERRIVRHMGQKSGWSRVLIDDAFVVFVRDDLREASAYPALNVLRPSYAMDWVFVAVETQREAMIRELAHLENVPSAQSYRHWVRALMELAPLRRGDERAGIRWPTHAEDWQRYRRAAAHLERAAAGARDVPLVAATHALALATLCRLDDAERALSRTLALDAPSREVVLAGQEIALRRGETERVREFITAALNTPEGRDDPWLHELSRGLSRAPSCP